ncbi:hypothetical protein [Sorangium sp. So ce513]
MTPIRRYQVRDDRRPSPFCWRLEWLGRVQDLYGGLGRRGPFYAIAA